MKKLTIPFLTLGMIFLFQILLFTAACTNDELPEPMVSVTCKTLNATYDTNVKAIIDESCAYNGCHDGSGGIGPLNYTNYDGLLTHLNSGSFRSRVLNTDSSSPLVMPPSKATYDISEKESLTDEELEIIECWLNAGFPEN